MDQVKPGASSSSSSSTAAAAAIVSDNNNNTATSGAGVGLGSPELVTKTNALAQQVQADASTEAQTEQGWGSYIYGGVTHGAGRTVNLATFGYLGTPSAAAATTATTGAVDGSDSSGSDTTTVVSSDDSQSKVEPRYARQIGEGQTKRAFDALDTLQDWAEYAPLDNKPTFVGTTGWTSYVPTQYAANQAVDKVIRFGEVKLGEGAELAGNATTILPLSIALKGAVVLTGSALRFVAAVGTALFVGLPILIALKVAEGANKAFVSIRDRDLNKALDEVLETPRAQAKSAAESIARNHESANATRAQINTKYDNDVAKHLAAIAAAEKGVNMESFTGDARFASKLTMVQADLDQVVDELSKLEANQPAAADDDGDISQNAAKAVLLSTKTDPLTTKKEAFVKQVELLQAADYAVRYIAVAKDGKKADLEQVDTTFETNTQQAVADLKHLNENVLSEDAINAKREKLREQLAGNHSVSQPVGRPGDDGDQPLLTTRRRRDGAAAAASAENAAMMQPLLGDDPAAADADRS